MSNKTAKRQDSNRTEKARAISIQRRNIRATYSKNGGRY